MRVNLQAGVYDRLQAGVRMYIYYCIHYILYMQTVRNVSHVFCCFFFASVADKDSQRRIATGAVSCMTANYCTPRESPIEMCTQYYIILVLYYE